MGSVQAVLVPQQLLKSTPQTCTMATTEGPAAKRAKTERTFLFSSESVNEGHPDKLCDQVWDAVLDACLKVDPKSKVACETACKDNMVMVLGEITTGSKLDYDAIVRGEVGPRRGRWGPGHHVRLRLRRDRGLHAPHSPARHVAGQEADGRAEEWASLVAAARRQDAGDRRIPSEGRRLRGASKDPHRGDLDPARRARRGSA